MVASTFLCDVCHLLSIIHELNHNFWLVECQLSLNTRKNSLVFYNRFGGKPAQETSIRVAKLNSPLLPADSPTNKKNRFDWLHCHCLLAMFPWYPMIVRYKNVVHWLNSWILILRKDYLMVNLQCPPFNQQLIKLYHPGLDKVKIPWLYPHE